MNKAKLVEHLASKTGLTKADSSRILNITLEKIKESIRNNDDVTLVGFGTFTRLERKTRMGRNPRTGQMMKIPGYTTPKFRAGKDFHEQVN